MSVIDQVSLADQIAEVKREIEQRKRVYIRMIDQEKMTKEEAERRSLTMVAVLQTLEGIRDLRDQINSGRLSVAAYPTVDSESANAAPDP
jgi:hypothetical protein